MNQCWSAGPGLRQAMVGGVPPKQFVPGGRDIYWVFSEKGILTCVKFNLV